MSAAADEILASRARAQHTTLFHWLISSLKPL